MSLLGELIAQLRGCVDQVRQATTSAAAARENAEQGLSISGAATEGSTNAEVLEAVANVQVGIDRLEEAARHFDAGRTALEQYIEGPLLGGAAGSGGPPPGPPPPPVTGAGSPRPFGEPIQGFEPKRMHPTAVGRIKREGWPSNAEGKTSARGVLYDSDGRQVREHPYRAYPKGGAPARPELREPWASDPQLTTTWHAEADMAADIRGMGPGDYALYLNVPPCGRSSKAPDRCDANLEKILPNGTTLYVWEIGENGSMTRYIYRGNGEAIK
jgi:hypothetical protein